MATIINRNTQTETVVCDEPAIEAWRKFAADRGYDLNDMRGRLAFGAGYLAGVVWGTEQAAAAAIKIIREGAA